jgi:hypothetical protein
MYAKMAFSEGDKSEEFSKFFKFNVQESAAPAQWQAKASSWSAAPVSQVRGRVYDVVRERIFLSFLHYGASLSGSAKIRKSYV